MNKDEALKMAIEAFELEESTWWSHTKMAKAYQACKEALKPHPDCDEACMYQCEMEKKHGMTYEQGFAHGYEAFRAEQELRIKNDCQS